MSNGNTHANNCILSSRCRVANSPKCNAQCSSFIALHGASGLGGRSAAAGLPKDYRLVTLDSSPVADNQPKIYETLRKYAATFERMFEDGDRIKSLYLYSESPGTGKTTSASALINEYLMAHYIGSLRRGKQALGRPAYFLDVNELQTLYNGFNRSNVPADIADSYARDYYKRMELAKKTPFIVCDDLGVRSASEAFRSDLHSIINYRTVNELPTVYTSNIPISELSEVFDSRLYDRINDQCAVLSFGGDSKRGLRR